MAADVKWLGTAAEVAQLDTMTVGGTIEAGDLFIMTLTGVDGTIETLTVAAPDTSEAALTAAIAAAWNLLETPLFAAITAADASPDITCTADTPGDAFTLTVETTETGGGAADDQTFSTTTTTANGGPKDWRDVDNWDLGALPGSGANHDVFIENFIGDIVYGLNQSGIGNTLDSLTIGASFTGKLGDNGEAGTIGDYLQIPSTIFNIGQHFGSGTPAGSPRIKINAAAVATTFNIYKTASPADSGKPAVRILADNAATDINVYRGSVGIAYESTEVSSINDVNVLWTLNRATDSSVFIDEGVTFGGTLTKTGGSCNLQVAVAAITHSSGTLNIRGSGATTTLTISGGTVNTVSSGTIGTISMTGGTLNAGSIGNVTTINMLGGTLAIVSGGTISTANVTGGSVTFKNTGNITTVTGSSGTITISGTATIGTLTAEGAAINSNASGTITAMTITGGTVDFTGSLTARTVTTSKLDAPGRLIYDPAVITMTNKIDSDNPVTLTAS